MFDVAYIPVNVENRVPNNYSNTSSSSSNGSPKLESMKNPKVPRTIKRKRLTLVCDSCKKKKIKCDKQSPCTSCVKSGVASTCNFSSVQDGKVPKVPAYVSSASRPILLNHHTSPLPKRKKEEELKPGQEQPSIDINRDSVELTTLAPKTEYSKLLSSGYAQNGSYSATNGPFTSNNDNLLSNNGSSAANNVFYPSRNGFNNISKSNNGTYSYSLPPAIGTLPAPSNGTYPVKNGTFPSNSALPLAQCIPSTTSVPNPDSRSPSITAKVLIPPSSIASSVSYQSSPAASTSRLTSSVSNTMAKIFSPAYDTPITLPSLNWKPIRQALELRGEVQPLEDPKTLKSRSVINSFVGINPVFYSNETIDFYSNSENPFSWSASMKSDEALKNFWTFICIQKDLQLDDLTSLPNNKPVRLDITKLTTIKYNNQGTPSDKFDTDYQSILRKSIERNKTVTKPLLIERIGQVMPNRKNVWKLMDRYFKFLYCFMPIVDESVFTAELEKIIGKQSFEDETKISHLNVTYKTDFITLGMMLLMMRMAYLSLFSNNDEQNVKGMTGISPCEIGQNLKYLLRNPINIDVAEVANECCEMFVGTDSLSLSLMQMMFLSKIYRRQAPEDSHSAEEADEFVDAELLRVAYGLKLNRDPESVDPSEAAPVKNIKRKIWHFIVLADMCHSYSFGNPSNLEDLYYDTQLPETNLSNSNLVKKERDIEITRVFFKPWKFADSLRHLLICVLDRKQKYKSAQMAERLNEFEVVFFQYNGDIADIVKKEFIYPPDLQGDVMEELYGFYLFSRNFHIKFFVSIASFLVSIYQHLYTYYSGLQKQNLAYFYLKKLFVFISETIPFYHQLLEGSDTQCDFVYNPSLQSLIHKSNLYNLGFVIRLNFVLFDNEKRQNPNTQRHSEYYQLVKSLKDTLTSYSEVMIRSISKLSNRYYYSWRITKGHNFFHAIVTNEQFYEYVYQHKQTEFQSIVDTTQFSFHQLQELYDLCYGCLTRTITCNSCENIEPQGSLEKPPTNDTGSIKAPSFIESNKTDSDPGFGDLDIDQRWLDLFFDSEPTAKDVSLFEVFNDFHQFPL